MKVINKKVFSDYNILEKFETGIKLTGAEVKSVKSGRITLKGAFVKIIHNQIYLINADIPPYSFARQENYKSKRTRKLLLHKKEIISLKSKQERKKLTIMPISCYTKRNLVKFEIALVKIKKKWNKREDKKRKDLEKDIRRELKGKY